MTRGDTSPRRLRLGTRGSTLARLQSGLVADWLRRRDVDVDLVTVVTQGDTRPPDTAWGEGAFVGALQEWLLEGRVDLAVHSAKDVPIEPVAGLVIAAYPPREDARDALVLARDRERPAAVHPLDLLAEGARVGTDSPRRSAFLRAARPDLRVVPLHGNVDTRLRRLDGGEVDALVLAMAGLLRLGRADRVSAVLDPGDLPPAPGQGALAVQCREDDASVRAILAPLDDPDTRRAVTMERAVLAGTGGGCRAPLGALAGVRGATVELVAGAMGADGEILLVRRSGSLDDSMTVAADVGRELLALGFRDDAEAIR